MDIPNVNNLYSLAPDYSQLGQIGSQAFDAAKVYGQNQALQTAYQKLPELINARRDEYEEYSPGYTDLAILRGGMDPMGTITELMSNNIMSRGIANNMAEIKQQADDVYGSVISKLNQVSSYSDKYGSPEEIAKAYSDAQINMNAELNGGQRADGTVVKTPGPGPSYEKAKQTVDELKPIIGVIESLKSEYAKYNQLFAQQGQLTGKIAGKPNAANIISSMRFKPINERVNDWAMMNSRLDLVKTQQQTAQLDLQKLMYEMSPTQMAQKESLSKAQLAAAQAGASEAMARRGQAAAETKVKELEAKEKERQATTGAVNYQDWQDFISKNGTDIRKAKESVLAYNNLISMINLAKQGNKAAQEGVVFLNARATTGPGVLTESDIQNTAGADLATQLKNKFGSRVGANFNFETWPNLVPKTVSMLSNELNTTLDPLKGLLNDFNRAYNTNKSINDMVGNVKTYQGSGGYSSPTKPKEVKSATPSARGTAGNPIKLTGSPSDMQNQFAKLPKGTYFVNPKDGKVLRK